MAESNSNTVLLGYQDEIISEKYLKTLNFTTNKFGGKPDWPQNFEYKAPLCPLCELERPLILQIYAPLDNSKYHRTLYIFACINPNCWNRNESWLCVRNQIIDISDTNLSCPNSTNSNIVTLDWCEDSDDWGDNANNNEENGNLVFIHNKNSNEDESDDDSGSFEEQMNQALKQMSVDDKNANTGLDSEGVGAVGRQNSPIATAEIENDESELVTIDAPFLPQNDLNKLLQEVAPLPHDLCRKNLENKIQFVPFFISVCEEYFGGNLVDKNDCHIRDLLHEYQQKNEENLLNIASNIPVDDGENVGEKYEKSVPAHGDKYFHYFLSRIQQNPGQILRYHRGGSPLILYPIQEKLKKCRHCQSDMIFELQILPTLISKLRLDKFDDEKSGQRLDYGTVLIFTCAKSCWSSDSPSQKYREEAVIVQYEK